MLNQMDIDNLMVDIKNDGKAYLYYVAHMIEPREGLLDEHIYKSSSKFKVIKIEVNDIKNAYFEYLKYVEDPSQFHIETEESYYDYNTKYINRYIVPNSTGPYTKDLNSRIPSIIYGYRREIFDTVNHVRKEITDPSPVKVVYTNTLEYSDCISETVKSLFNDGKLSWKYKKLNNKEIVDGIEYEYITSDWYILDVKNFPRTEMPLVNIKQNSAYFVDLVDAFYYIDQLEA